MKLKLIKNLTQILLVIPLILLVGNNTLFSSNEISNDNLTKTVEEKVIAVHQEELAETMLEETKPIKTFDGNLTAYIANCKDGCTGKLACAPKHKGIYYNDKIYKEVRIVATSSNYPCGTILKFKVGKKEITAVALDKGVRGNTVDLLSETTRDAYQIGRRNISFEVLRTGW